MGLNNFMYYYEPGGKKTKEIGLPIVYEGEITNGSYGDLNDPEKEKAEQEKNDAVALAGSIYDSRMSMIGDSQGALDRKNYLAYRRLVDMYLPEYLNSSGLYDAGSMSQAFLDAKNGYISKSEDIARTYDAQRTEAGIDLAQRKADALSVYQDKIDEIDATTDSKYRGIRDELLGYLDVAAYSGEGDSWDFDALENFAETYAKELDTLKRYDIEYYNQVARALNNYLEMDSYKAAYEDKVEADAAEAEAKAEQERVAGIQANVINLADEGYVVVGGDTIKRGEGKNFVIAKGEEKFGVDITQREESSEIKTAADNLENGQAFIYKGKLYVKLSDGIFSVGARYWSSKGYDSLMENFGISTKPKTQETTQTERDALVSAVRSGFISANASPSGRINSIPHFEYMTDEELYKWAEQLGVSVDQPITQR